MGAGLSLGQRIREVRLRKQLTQNDVVGEYMTRNMLSKIENGNAAPSVKTLEYLSQALEVPVSYFLEGEERDGVDMGQLRLIDDIAREIAAEAPSLSGLALCIRARAQMSAGRTDDALALFDGLDGDIWPEHILKHVYLVLEDCHREKGDYKRAYEYALKRLAAEQ